MKNQTKKNFICQIDSDLHADIELIRKATGINWSYKVRKFLQEEVQKLMPNEEESIEKVIIEGENVFEDMDDAFRQMEVKSYINKQSSTK